MAGAEWIELQKKIFTRFLNQKLKQAPEKLHIEDCVTDFQGHVIVSLVQFLSEKKCPYKIAKKLTKFTKIDNAVNALKFVYKDTGVDMKVQASAENICDGEERPVLGLIWAIMKKYLKFGDEDGELSALDSLKMWVNNQIKDYNNIEVKSFKKSFHDGMVLGALIHKFRPKLIDFDSLYDKSIENRLKIVFQAAEDYFGLEQFLKPSDIPKLDEKSMLIYVSEFYYGIAEMRKIDLACRRINKLITFTKINDELRANYNKTAIALRAHLDQVEELLNDRSIDNTLAGAQKRLEDFNTYKAKDKSLIIERFLAVETLYNQLALRLADKQRPEFKPDEKCSVPELNEALVHLEGVEKERQAALIAELNRQLTLRNINRQHTDIQDRIMNWVGEKKNYLDTDVEINSIGAANFALNVLANFHEEVKSKHKTVKHLESLGEKLTDEKTAFELADEVVAREKALHDAIAANNDHAGERKVEYDAALVREIKKEELRLSFADKAGDFYNWVKDAQGDVSVYDFGLTLEEVTKYQTVLEEDSNALKVILGEKLGVLAEVDEQVIAMNVVENSYTDHTLEGLNGIGAELEGELAKRDEAFAAELARQQENDALCKKFAGLVEPVFEFISKAKDDVTNNKDDLEQQLQLVQKHLAEDDFKVIGEIEELEGTMKERGIISNNYTLNNFADTEVQISQYKSFLTVKEKSITDEIRTKKLRGITQAQYDEIKEQFAQFDKNGSDTLDIKELKACLFSLGLETPKSELKKIMEEYGDEKGDIQYENFRELMITILGDAGGKVEIDEGFELIADLNDSVVTKAQLDKVPLDDEDITFMLSTAPKVDDGYSYKEWSTEVYSR